MVNFRNRIILTVLLTFVQNGCSGIFRNMVNRTYTSFIYQPQTECNFVCSILFTEHVIIKYFQIDKYLKHSLNFWI